MDLPPVLYITLGDFGDLGIGIAGDPVETMDEAADDVAEFHKHNPDAGVRVLRIASSLNTDDVTVDALDIIAARMKGRAA